MSALPALPCQQVVSSSAQVELLGQLDLADAEAQTARWALAEAQTAIVALEEEACHEREVSTAARRRADVVERHMAGHQREVRSAPGFATSQTPAEQRCYCTM